MKLIVVFVLLGTSGVCLGGGGLGLGPFLGDDFWSSLIGGGGCQQAPPTIHYGYVLGNNQYYTDGQTVTYRCNPGYKMVGNPSMRCSYDRWNGMKPDCVKVNQCGVNEVHKKCAKPRSCQTCKHAYGMLTCILSCDLSNCECKPGFFRGPNGNCIHKNNCPNPCASVLCKSGEKCEVVNGVGVCKPICTGAHEMYSMCASQCQPSCHKTMFDKCTKNCNRDVQCVCKPGYIWNSPLDRRCIKPINCPVCHNHHCKMNEHCYPFDKDSYDCRCNKGYVKGKRGCEKITCDAPPTPADGGYSPSQLTYYYMDMITYTCNAGFRMVAASAEKQCAVTGYFEPSGDVTCEDIDECAEGLDDCVQYAQCINTHGSFMCNCYPQYTGDGRTACNPIQCPSPSPPTPGGAGYIEGNAPYYIGAIVTYKCNPGYTLVGYDTTQCQPGNGYPWSNPPPECKKITCDPLMQPKNGGYTLVQDIYNYMDTITYTCDTGFQLVAGSAVKRCAATGYFEPSGDVICDDIDECKLGIDNCNELGQCINTYGSFKCQCGRYSYGDGVTCTPYTCNKPASPSHGFIFGTIKDVYSVGDTVTYKCKIGYKLVGYSQTQCQASMSGGIWTNPPPACEPVGCGRPVTKSYASFVGPVADSYPVGSTVKYRCNQNPMHYYGSGSIRCVKKAFGAYGWTMMTCKEHSCKNKCGRYFADTKRCRCDRECTSKRSCCFDFQSVCPQYN